jgi:hypothetical protein
MQGCRESAKERAFLCDEYQTGNVVDGLNQPPRMTVGIYVDWIKS